MSRKFIQKDGTFSLFKNNYKDKETQPDYKGQITWVNGTIKQIAAWKKETKKGDIFFAGAISDFKPSNPSKKPEDQPRQVDAITEAEKDFDDDMPF